MKYDEKFASRWRAKSPDALCAVLPKECMVSENFEKRVGFCRILSNVRNLDVDKSNEMLYNKEQQ